MIGRARPGIAIALVCLTCALLFGSASSGRAGRDRPPPGFTGGFSEPTCQTCHVQDDVNAGTGSVHIEGVPPAYERDTAYTLTITLAQNGLAAGGFEMSARFEDGAQAGRFAARGTDPRIDVTTLAGIQYAHHVFAGTAPLAPDTAQWQIVWTAPASDGVVVFHIAANAADDDYSPIGDMIYTASVHTAGR